jgi:hypothetical protein
MTEVYEFSEFERNNLLYNYVTLTQPEIDVIKTKIASSEKEQATKKAAEAQAKQTPAPPAPPRPGKDDKKGGAQKT